MHSCLQSFRKCLFSVLLVLGWYHSVQAQWGTPQKINTQRLVRLLHDWHGPTIVNFWATWCGPCVDEMPTILHMAQDHRTDSLRVILVSLDYPDAYPAQIRRFMRSHHLTLPVYWLDLTHPEDLVRLVDPEWKGVIPLTLMLDPDRHYRKIYEQEMTPKQWEQHTEDLLQQAKTP